MIARRFNITMNEELLQQLDTAAELEYASRSDFIRVAIVERLARLKAAQQLDPQAVSNQELEEALKILNAEHLKRSLYRDNENC